MKAASREALATVESMLDGILSGDNSVATATQAGQDLFEVVSVLDSDRELRVALTDDAASVEERKSLARTLFAGKVSPVAQQVLEEAAAAQWSTPRDIARGLVKIGRRALLRGAESEGKLGQVEDEPSSLPTFRTVPQSRAQTGSHRWWRTAWWRWKVRHRAASLPG